MVARLARLPVVARWVLVTKFLLVRQVSSAKLNMLLQALLLLRVLMLLTVANCSMWLKVYKNKLQLHLQLRITIVLKVVDLQMVTTIMMVPPVIKHWQLA